MTVIDSGACRTSGGAGQTAATQASNGLRGSSFQDRADALVRATVLSDLGQSAGHGRHSHGIQGVAAAIRKVLSAQDVAGTDASDDVLKKIETSLHKAAQALADRGVDAKTIDATIDRFRGQLADALDRMGGAPGSAGARPGGPPGADGASAGSSGVDGSSAGSAGMTSGSGGSAPAPASSATSVSKFVSREVRKERGAIDLVTAEGDHVSIRFRSKDVVTGSAVQATGSDGTSVSAAKSSLFSRGGVNVEVDGNLNEDELKAINDLLGKVDDIATKFYSGDVQAAFSAAGSLGVDSDQIAAYRLDVTYSRKVAAAYSAASVASLPAATQTPASSPVQAPSSSATQTSANSSTGSSTTKAAAFAAVLSQRYWSATRLVISASGSSVGAPTSASSSSSSATSTPPSSSSVTSAPGSSDAAAPAPAAHLADLTAPASTTDSSAAASGSTATDAAPSTSATNADAGSPTANATDDLPAATTSDTPPASPASAQKTIIDFINDTLSKLDSANGAGRVSFSLHWKINALATALDSVQPAQPTTPADQTAAANTKLLNDSLQKITPG